MSFKKAMASKMILNRQSVRIKIFKVLLFHRPFSFPIAFHCWLIDAAATKSFGMVKYWNILYKISFGIQLMFVELSVIFLLKILARSFQWLDFDSKTPQGSYNELGYGLQSLDSDLVWTIVQSFLIGDLIVYFKKSIVLISFLETDDNLDETSACKSSSSKIHLFSSKKKILFSNDLRFID